jgi:hypothetical protein
MTGNERNRKTLAERFERAVTVMVGDLSLLFSLYTARFLVWLTLRRRERARAREHAERRKQFKSASATVWTKTR